MISSQRANKVSWTGSGNHCGILWGHRLSGFALTSWISTIYHHEHMGITILEPNNNPISHNATHDIRTRVLFSGENSYKVFLNNLPVHTPALHCTSKHSLINERTTRNNVTNRPGHAFQKHRTRAGAGTVPFIPRVLIPT